MNKKILVIDDEEFLTELTRNVLQKRGYTVLAQKDGTNALATVKRNQIDLIIIDNLLPGRDGTQICQEIKSDESTKHIPILMTTGQINVEDHKSDIRKRLQPNDYLIKPFEIEDLVRKVEDLLC